MVDGELWQAGAALTEILKYRKEDGMSDIMLCYISKHHFIPLFLFVLKENEENLHDDYYHLMSMIYSLRL